MAQWTTQITVTNLPSKRIRVTATRTDGETTWSQSVDSIVDPADLPGTRDKINNAIWAEWEAEVAKQAQIATMLTGYEAAIAADLNAREGA